MKSETREKYEAELKSTHNTREKIEEIKLLVSKAYYEPNQSQYYAGDEKLDRILSVVEKAFHQELQKARQDWLREEIVKLEGMRQIIGGRLEISADESLVEMFGNVIELKEEMSHNSALQTIIDRYLLELESIAQK